MRIFSILESIGVRPADPPELRLQKNFMVYLGCAMSCGGLLWGSLSAAYGLYAQSLIPYGYTAATILNFSYFHRTSDFKRVRFVQVLLSMLLPFAFQFVLGGFVKTGAVMLWALISLIGAFTFEDLKNTLYWIAAYALLTISMGFLDPWTIQALNLPAPMQILLFAMNITVISVIVAGLSYYFLSSRSAVMRELWKAKSETDAIMGAVDQGLCLLDRNAVVGAEHSASFAGFFKQGKVAGQSLLDLLAQNGSAASVPAARDFIDLIFEDRLNPNKIHALNPLAEVSLAGDTPLIATTRFIPVRGSDGEVVRVLGAFTDVTARKKMEAELVRNQEDLRTHNLAVGEILANGRDPVESFLEDSSEGLATMEETLRKSEESRDFAGTLTMMMRTVHTIKGNASLLNLTRIVERAHSIESDMQASISAGADGPAILGHLIRIQDVKTELADIRALVERITSFSETEAPEIGLQTFARRIASETRKLVEVEVTGTNSWQGHLTRAPLRSVVTQLLRNSIVHGIELPEERQRASKPPAGRVRIHCTPGEAGLSLKFEDDGRGLDVELIRH
jgi:HPt (histidine-containing phosphotransfer) domain-containing protein/PAS domain-containing protein